LLLSLSLYVVFTCAYTTLEHFMCVCVCVDACLFCLLLS
jgi:hypothetical protein